MRILLVSMFTLGIASAQIVSFGVKGGVPATDAVTGISSSPSHMLDTGRWTIGPTIELRLLYGFSVEADALYRRYREQFSFGSPEFIPPGSNTIPAVYGSSQSNNKVWDFPVLLKYRVPTRRIHPFVDAGYTFSHRTSDFSGFQSCLSGVAVCQTFGVPLLSASRGSFSVNSGGPGGGVGVEYRYRKIKIAPEVRYTHQSNPAGNRVTVMVGFTR